MCVRAILSVQTDLIENDGRSFAAELDQIFEIMSSDTYVSCRLRRISR